MASRGETDDLIPNVFLIENEQRIFEVGVHVLIFVLWSPGSIEPSPRQPRQTEQVMNASTPPVGLIMGSQSDWPTMRHAADVLDTLELAYEKRIVSAHRTPERMYDYARTASERGLKVIIAGAGGAAHLPGMVAALTCLPVLGVPVESRAMKGLDSLYSIVQMPAGVPVGTLAIGTAGATNAGLLAAQIIALADAQLGARLADWRQQRTDGVASEPTDET